MNLRFTRVESDISAIAGHLIFSLSLLNDVARKFITRGEKKPPAMQTGRPHSLGDIFFLNSFAGDYSSAITTLTKRETAQNRGEVQSVPSRLPFYISNGDFTASCARLWRGKEKKRVGGGPFELLMRKELPRLLSINFSNYEDAEDVPPEERTVSISYLLSFILSTPSLYHSYSHPRYP